VNVKQPKLLFNSFLHRVGILTTSRGQYYQIYICYSQTTREKEYCERIKIILRITSKFIEIYFSPIVKKLFEFNYIDPCHKKYLAGAQLHGQGYSRDGYRRGFNEKEIHGYTIVSFVEGEGSHKL
jgi:hypothetical protein